MVSLGLSCQTAHQCTRFALESGGATQFVKGPFDWLICPPASLAAWLDDGLCDFDPSDIISYRGHAFWPRYGFWFWHGFFRKEGDHKVLDITNTAERELAKLAHQRDVFFSVDARSTTFVWSNSQGNLDDTVFLPAERARYRANRTTRPMLEAALQRVFNSDVHLTLVSTPARQWKATAKLIEPDVTEWKGDDHAWNRLLDV